eukprot:5959969-Amphidinium_carterae.1
MHDSVIEPSSSCHTDWYASWTLRMATKSMEPARYSLLHGVAGSQVAIGRWTTRRRWSTPCDRPSAHQGCSPVCTGQNHEWENTAHHPVQQDASH